MKFELGTRPLPLLNQVPTHKPTRDRRVLAPTATLTATLLISGDLVICTAAHFPWVCQCAIAMTHTITALDLSSISVVIIAYNHPPVTLYSCCNQT